MKLSQQAPHLMMVRPVSFGFNQETAGSNTFQKQKQDNDLNVRDQAIQEFDYMTDVLTSHDIPVMIVEDTIDPVKPDAVFPNNWISFHHDGTLVLYPMLAENRRLERRQEIVDQVKDQFRINRVVDFSDEEKKGNFLEGTGSIVFDYANQIAYANRSPRTTESLVNRLCKEIGFTPIVFDAVDEAGTPVYHTNVLMCVGEKFVVICLDAIKKDEDQEKLLQHFSATNRKVIAISYAQMNLFAGNMIEVRSREGDPFVLMSETALQSLLPGQVNAITQFAEIIPIKIPTIEQVGGGSVRCMVAGIFLPKASFL